MTTTKTPTLAAVVERMYALHDRLEPNRQSWDDLARYLIGFAHDLDTARDELAAELDAVRDRFWREFRGDASDEIAQEVRALRQWVKPEP